MIIFRSGFCDTACFSLKILPTMAQGLDPVAARVSEEARSNH